MYAHKDRFEVVYGGRLNIYEVNIDNCSATNITSRIGRSGVRWVFDLPTMTPDEMNRTYDVTSFKYLPYKKIYLGGE